MCYSGPLIGQEKTRSIMKFGAILLLSFLVFSFVVDAKRQASSADPKAAKVETKKAAKAVDAAKAEAKTARAEAKAAEKTAQKAAQKAEAKQVAKKAARAEAKQVVKAVQKAEAKEAAKAVKKEMVKAEIKAEQKAVVTKQVKKAIAKKEEKAAQEAAVQNKIGAELALQAEIEKAQQKIKSSSLGVFYKVLKTLHNKIREQTKSIEALTLLSEKTAELIKKAEIQQKKIRKTDKLLEKRSQELLTDLSEKFKNKCK
eukprot:TRINITY_DN3603_c0_g1_i14.p1 TRINITY_DN3603_c0_g1~~TRINITY_DN3603_c0_g1_i14.p1  ORF type:complete len:257 (-),score=91.65 TRINITY_DN3603_c0_g1_i14:264-1034(-)